MINSMIFQPDFAYLLKAIKEKKSIDIIYKEEDKTWSYSSCFVKLSSAGQSFIIDLPFMGEDTYKPLEIGYSLQIIFKLAGFRFQFESKVQDKIEYITDKREKIPALQISWPYEIIEENLRSFFRIKLSINESIFVSYNILDDEGEKKEKKAARKDEKVEYLGVEAIIVDISENGLGIKINRPRNVKVNDKLRLIFRLKDLDDENIEIYGIIKHIQDCESNISHFCGIEFSAEDSLEHKQNIRKLTFYLMSRYQENVNFLPVDSIVSTNPLVKRIIDGEAGDEILNSLLDKEFRLSNEEYLESLVYMLNMKGYESRTSAILQSIPIRVKMKYLSKMEANHKVASYLLKEAIKNRSIEIISVVTNNQYLPVELWLKIAREGTESMLELLLAKKNKLIAYPEVMDVIYNNPIFTPMIKEKIERIMNHYLKDVEPEIIPMEGVIGEVQKVIKKQMKERGEKLNIYTTAAARMEAIYILRRINKLCVRERVRLAFYCNKPERMVLTRDTNKEVLLSLLESPWTGEDEILNILKNNKIEAEIVNKIADNFFFLRNYSIIFLLIKHPKLPLKKAAGFIKKLKRKDLKQIIINKEVKPEVLDMAEKFLKKMILI